MNFLERLMTAHGSMSILSLDPSINKLGYAHIRYNSEKVEIVEIGLITSNPEFVEHQRIFEVVDKVCTVLNEIIHTRDRTVIYIERPATVYQSKGKTTGRAYSIMKLCMVYGALTYASRQMGFQFKPILPSQWQQKIKCKKVNIKQTSLVLANERLKDQCPVLGSGKINGVRLHTSMDENIADAINIAYEGMALERIGNCYAVTPKKQ